MVDALQGHALLAVHLGQAAEVDLGVIGHGVRAEVHELEAHVDDVATVWVTVGGLDVDAEDGALDGLGDVGNTEVVAVAANLADDRGLLALLQRRHLAAEVVVTHAAGEAGVSHVVEALCAHLVHEVAVAVCEVADDVIRERGIIILGELLAQRLHGLLVLLALGVHGAKAAAIDELGEEEGVRMLECLGYVHRGLLFWGAFVPACPVVVPEGMVSRSCEPCERTRNEVGASFQVRDNEAPTS